MRSRPPALRARVEADALSVGQMQAIAGVSYVRLARNSDARGSLDVVFDGRAARAATAQWNVVRSFAGTLRGMHAHSRYDEYYTALSGRMFLALKDARRASPTFAATQARWLDGAADPLGVVVPAGVAHGVYFETDSILAYGLSAPWTGAHEFACRWSDPELGVAWPAPSAVVSTRDAQAGSWAAMVEALDADLG